jgi:hypothetical protein
MVSCASTSKAMNKTNSVVIKVRFFIFEYFKIFNKSNASTAERKKGLEEPGIFHDKLLNCDEEKDLKRS